MAATVPLWALRPQGVLAASGPLALVPLGDRLWRITGLGANAVVASSDEGLLLVDGGPATQSGALARLLGKQFPRQSVRTVINTHWHALHSGFNATARKAGADVVAHENTRLWLSTVVNDRAAGTVHAPQPTSALPNRTFFYGPQSLEFGGRKIEYAHLGQAHTDGDLYVRFVEENVLVVGDVVSPEGYPVVDPASNGWLGGLHGATKTLISRCDAATRVIAGQGEPCQVDRAQGAGRNVFHGAGTHRRELLQGSDL